MKTILFCFVLLAFLHTQAQQPDYGIVLKKENNTYVALHINNVNPHAVRNLVTTYENAINLEWTIDENGITADFINNKKTVKLNYDNLGNLLTARISYTGESLEPFLAKYAKRLAGKDYTVERVTEVNRGEKIIYEINLQNHSQICIITLVTDKQKGIERTDSIIKFIKAT